MNTYEVMAYQFAGLFWTKLSEMKDDIEDMGFEVEDINNEYVLVTDGDFEYQMYLGCANCTRWITQIVRV